MGTVNVLEAARINGVGRVHLASTVWVYNGAPDGVTADESMPFYLNGAGHLYTLHEDRRRDALPQLPQLYGVPFTVLRYGIPYGPRMREELLIPLFIKKALARRATHRRRRRGASTVASCTCAISRRRTCSP